jgi:hypothetical protein
VIFPAFKAGDPFLRGTNGAFDSHTPPPNPKNIFGDELFCWCALTISGVGVEKRVKKCIIVHFLEMEKTGKALNAEFAETQRKDLRKIGEDNTPGPPEGGPYDFPVSPLFA